MTDVETFTRAKSTKEVKEHLLPRTSGHYCVNLCDHCEHDHSLECCMYVFDDVSDIARYAYFKKGLDEPYCVLSNSEDFNMEVGDITPPHFPTYTENDPDVANFFFMLSQSGLPFHLPRVPYPQQYWPIFVPTYQAPTACHFGYPDNAQYLSPPAPYCGYILQPVQQLFVPCIASKAPAPLQRVRPVPFIQPKPVTGYQNAMPMYYC